MSSSSQSSAVRPQIRWRSDLDKSCLIANFEKRGWIRCPGDDDWNFYWATVHTVRHMFSPESGVRLTDSQVLNHFPNHVELTRKDLMIKNIKRYKKEADKEGGLQETDAEGNKSVFDFVPMTYILPGDYSLFVEEFKKNPNQMWIMKPSSKARGIGIFIITKLNQIKRWARERWPYLTPKDQYVISRYVDNPLLIGGKKFDLRIYVLVTAYRPLKAFMYRKGFARFCTKKYTKDVSEIDDVFIHLTNVALQKSSSEYNEKHGGKWTIENLRLYLESTRGKEATDRLFHNIRYICIHSLKACQNVIINDRHCFECYGYDLLIDDQLKPWLLEINASPSLSATTHNDRLLKHALIHDVISIVMPRAGDPYSAEAVGEHETYQDTLPKERLGDFELIYDESLDAQEKYRGKDTSSQAKRPPSRK